MPSSSGSKTKPKKQLARWLDSVSLLLTCLSYDSAIKMEPVYTCQTSANFYQTIRSYIARDNVLFIATAMGASNPTHNLARA
jgi:hypothetical protein